MKRHYTPGLSMFEDVKDPELERQFNDFIGGRTIIIKTNPVSSTWVFNLFNSVNREPDAYCDTYCEKSKECDRDNCTKF